MVPGMLFSVVVPFVLVVAGLLLPSGQVAVDSARILVVVPPVVLPAVAEKGTACGKTRMRARVRIFFVMGKPPVFFCSCTL
jgi:hypothetical protein